MNVLRFSIKILLRNIKKNTLHFLLNLLGLTIGVTCFLFAILFVFYENNFDNYQVNKDRISRIVTTVTTEGVGTHTALSNGFLTNLLPKEFPEISDMVRFGRYNGRAAVRRVDKSTSIALENIYYAEASTFKVFSYPLIRGDRRSCLKDPKSIVLARKVALRLFGHKEALGEAVILNGEPLKVTGIAEDLPGNSDLPWDALISISTLSEEGRNDWLYTYILFNNRSARDVFEGKLEQFTNKNINPELAKSGASFYYSLEPIGVLHFSNYSIYDTPKGNKAYVQIFLITGILVLLIAFTNSINMTVVRSFSRTLETSIQKIHGAGMGTLLFQHVLESVVVGAAAIGLSFGLVWILLGQYAGVVGRTLVLSDLFNWKIGVVMGSALLLLGAGGALYTGLYLRRVKVVELLRANNSKGYHMGVVPKLLLGFQFFISMGMITGALLVHRQVVYLKETPLGFNPKNVLVLELPQGLKSLKKDRYLRNLLNADPDILLTSLGSEHSLPGDYADIDFIEYREKGVKVKKMTDNISADANFLRVLEVPVIKGAGFGNEKDSGDHKDVMTTESFARRAGWDHPVGEVITQLGDDRSDKIVTGIVPDFHFNSLHNPITPLVIFSDPDDPAYLLARVGEGKSAAVISRVSANWNKVFPEHPFYYYFLDQHVLGQYQDDIHLLSLLMTLASLIIGISCMGLVVYTSYMMRIAMRDIAIRRILGASFRDVFNLFNRPFALLLIIAFAAALPLSLWAIRRWLDRFSYHVQPGITDFLVAVVAMTTLVAAVVLFHVRKNMRTQPAKIIREA